jgi:hypothetical protein
LGRERPFVRAEVYKLTTRAQREALFGFMARMGYEIRRIESETHYRGQVLTPADLMRWQHFDVFCVPDEAARA